MQLELIEKLPDENLAEVFVGRLLVDRGRQLVTARRLGRPLLATPGALEKLALASEAAAALQHPQTLTHLGLFEAAGNHYWLSERTEGFDLGTVFGRLSTREVRISPLRTLQIGVDFLAGLVALHESGQVHGGLGPRCVVIDLAGVARLDGIGLEAALMDLKELKQKTRRGRRDHLAPEVLQGRKPEVSADVYSATALLYQLLTGQEPLGGQSQGVSTRHQAVQPPSKVDRSLPFSCDAVFVKALSSAPRNRHESGASLRNAIQRLRKSLLTGADEGRTGVAEFMATLYPNEAHVAGMPGTIDRPTLGDPITLSGQDITLRAPPPPNKASFGGGEGSITQPGVPIGEGSDSLETSPGEVPPALPGVAGLGFPETAEPLDSAAAAGLADDADLLAGTVEHEVLGASEQPTAVARVLPAPARGAAISDELATVRADSFPSFADEGEADPQTEEQALSDALQTAPPPVHDTEELPRASAAQGPPASGPSMAASVRSAYRRPAFIIAAVLIGLLLISLFILASGLFSSEPEVGLTGPPSDQTSLIGFLSVVSNNKTRITLDGEILEGATPLTNKVLQAGAHRLLVQTEQGAVLMDEVIEISPGEHKEIRLLLAPGGDAGGSLVAPPVGGGEADGGLSPDGGVDAGPKAKPKAGVRKRKAVKRKRAKKATRRTRVRRKTR